MLGVFCDEERKMTRPVLVGLAPTGTFLLRILARNWHGAVGFVKCGGSKDGASQRPLGRDEGAARGLEESLCLFYVC